jgi:hypothetical protein
MAKLFAILRPPLPIMVMAIGAAAVGIANMFSWRNAKAKELYLAQCDVALAHPRLSDPVDLDMGAQTMGGSKQEFERYEWYVARLVYTLDECLRLCPDAQWDAVAKTQLGAHREYFNSDHYARQDYLQHYSPRMRMMIVQLKKRPI